MEKAAQPLDRNFWLLWQGQLVSQFGTQVFLVTLALWLKQKTDSATLLGVLLMIGSAPAVLFGPLSGVLVDRYPRRTILIVGDLVRGLNIIVVASVMTWWTGSVSVAVAVLMVATLVGGLVQAVWQPAAMSLMPELVPAASLARANSIFQGTLQVCGLLAYGVAGVLYQALGAPLLALADGLSYLYAAFSDSLVRLPPPAARPAVARPNWASLKADVLAGFAYVHARPGMKRLFYTMAFLQFFMAPMSVLLPFYVDEHLVAGPEWYGFLLAVYGLGTLVGYIAASVLRPSGGAAGWLVGIVSVLASLAMGSLGLVSTTGAALWIAFGSGALNAFLNIKLVTALQLATPAEIRGRIFGLMGTITGGLVPLAMALTGVIADLTDHNAPALYLVCGGISALLSVSVTLRRECREFFAERPPSAVAPAPRPAEVGASS